VPITREELRLLLQVAPPELRPTAIATDDRGDHVVEQIAFETAGGDRIRGILCRPSGSGTYPAVLYAHAHGGAYEIGASELVDGRPALLSPLGALFAAAGYVTLCIDMPTFGERQQPGESALSKARLWYGKSLFGQMLSEQAAALTYLAARPDVAAERIGMFGLSMGSTLSYWLAAVDERISAIAHLCCYADFATLIETGAHEGHGIYLTVPGLLAATSTGEIGGLVAPRPQLICVGDNDPLTPPLAVDRALAVTQPMYGDGPLEVLRQADVGHEETQQMRAAVFDFFARTLRP
jgi:dienelactone hydrolase